MKNLILLCLLIFGFFNVQAQKNERFVKFVDEAKKDASFLAFRTKLIAAARRHDTKYILSILDKEIQNSRNGTDGIKEFKDEWKIEKRGSPFWDEFLRVITGGGKFADSGEKKNTFFIAPFDYLDLPDDLAGADRRVIFGNNVSLRAKPEMNARVVGKLSYNIVEVTETVMDKKETDKEAWYKIKTLGGKTGFVKAEFIRGQIEYRAGFVKKNGKWKMMYFYAGN